MVVPNFDNYDTPKCTYKKKFPVDEFGRPGGSYSTTDQPVAGEKTLKRVGLVMGMDLETQVYEVKDHEKGWVFLVPFDDVKIVEDNP